MYTRTSWLGAPFRSCKNAADAMRTGTESVIRTWIITFGTLHYHYISLRLQWVGHPNYAQTSHKDEHLMDLESTIRWTTRLLFCKLFTNTFVINSGDVLRRHNPHSPYHQRDNRWIYVGHQPRRHIVHHEKLCCKECCQYCSRYSHVHKPAAQSSGNNLGAHYLPLRASRK